MMSCRGLRIAAYVAWNIGMHAMRVFVIRRSGALSVCIQAATVCTQACRNVSLFGLSTGDPCAPFHYFDPPPSPCTLAVPERYDHPFHWFEREHALYRGWRQGRVPGRRTLTIHS